MREIKFRAWIGVEMVSPDFIDRKGLAFYSQDSFSVSSTDIMQFTGLKDCNGKEIYEGDIVDGRLFHNGSTLPTMGAVLFCEEYAAFGLKNLSGITLFHNHDKTTFKVIGNIYENPELLK